MPDYMPENQYGERPEADANIRIAKNILGIVLIIAGCLLAYWVCAKIFMIFDDPQKLEIFSQIVPLDPEQRALEIEGQKIILPLGLFKFMAYGIGAFLLMIAASIAIGLITGGVNLLQPGIQKLETKLMARFATMETKSAMRFDDLKNKIEEKGGGN